MLETSVQSRPSHDSEQSFPERVLGRPKNTIGLNYWVFECKLLSYLSKAVRMLFWDG